MHIEWLESALRTLASAGLTTVEILLLLFSVYTVLIAIMGLRKPKVCPTSPPRKRFALITAAHNEAEVIGPHVESLLHLDYPRELFDIYVIADNCTDSTAEIAGAYGVHVLQRTNPVQRGKGFAIEWALAQVLAGDRYDAIAMFDADNLVTTNFLQVANNYLCQGSKAVQVYLDSKNPWDSWISACYSINFWSLARTWQLARRNLGLSSALMGTGLCLDAQLLKELGWGATSLTEDMEYTSKMISRGLQVDWAHEVRIFDEKPITFAQTWKQRMRWVQGHWNVAGRYTLPLLKRFFTTGEWRALDMTLYLLQPAVLVVWTLYTLFNLAGVIMGHPVYNSVTGRLPLPLMIVLSVVGFLYPALGMMADRVPFRAYLYYPIYLVYSISWVPISFIAWFKRNDTAWSHTKHTRGLRLDQVAGQTLPSSRNLMQHTD